MRGLKSITAALAISILPVTAQAVSMEDLQFTALKLAGYSKMCTPLAAKTQELVDSLISTIGERERFRMVGEIQAGMRGMSTADFCDALRPSVDQLDHAH